MKTYPIGLLNDVTGTYDQTKTTIAGRVFQKTINTESVLGPPLTDKFDIMSDTASAITTTGLTYVSPNGRFFVLSAIATGVAQIALYDFNLSTGAKSYRGRIILNFPNTAATTHVLRGLRVTGDSGATGWKIWIATTGSVLINGGLFLVNKIDLADFIGLPVTPIPFATGNDQKAFYFLQDPSTLGASNPMTASAGVLLQPGSSRIYIHNGVAATHQYHVFDLAAVPTYALAAVTVSVATPGVVSHTGHPFQVNDPVMFMSGASLPTGLAFNTVYFVRNPGANSYELSATSGGASINTTGVVGSANIGRAWGTTGSNFLFKTGNLPALVGTLMVNNSEDGVTPQHSTNSGFECAFFATTTNLYLGRLSDLSAGVTSWPSLITSNILGSGIDITVPTVVAAGYSEALDMAVYVTAASMIVLKQLVNNSIYAFFGRSTTEWFEGTTRPTYPAAPGAITSIEVRAGWLIISGTTIGQRMYFALDMRSDGRFDYSSIISPVFTGAQGVLHFVKAIEELYEYTEDYTIQYRTSGFGSAAGGWIDLPSGEFSEIVVPASGIQFKILFDIATSNAMTPAQLHELELGLTPLNELSDNWVGSHDNTSSVSPAKSAFRLIKAYPTSVPKLYFRAYDDSNTLVASANTVDNPALFEYSTNNGTSWLPLGTIPNTPSTTELRYNWAVPPGVKVTISIQES